MRRIKEVLRLKQALGLSDAAVARGARVARSTVKQYLDRAAAADLSWETAEGLSERSSTVDCTRPATGAMSTVRCRIGRRSIRNCAAAV